MIPGGVEGTFRNEFCRMRPRTWRNVGPLYDGRLPPGADAQATLSLVDATRVGIFDPAFLVHDKEMHPLFSVY
jgi:hypothetical protein